MKKLSLDTTILQHQPWPSPWPRHPWSRPLRPGRPPGLSLLLSACLVPPQGVRGMHVCICCVYKCVACMCVYVRCTVCVYVCACVLCMCIYVVCTSVWCACVYMLYVHVCSRGVNVCVCCVHVCMVLGELYPHALTAGSVIPLGPPQPGLRWKEGPVTFHLGAPPSYSVSARALQWLLRKGRRLHQDFMGAQLPFLMQNPEEPQNQEGRFLQQVHKGAGSQRWGGQ